MVYKAKAEKYAKIISKTIILFGMDAASFGQNAYFYDAAEGLLMATILLVAEFCEPAKRHIVAVFKIIQELLALSNKKGKNQFQQLVPVYPRRTSHREQDPYLAGRLRVESHGLRGPGLGLYPSGDPPGGASASERLVI